MSAPGPFPDLDGARIALPRRTDIAERGAQVRMVPCGDRQSPTPACGSQNPQQSARAATGLAISCGDKVR